MSQENVEIWRANIEAQLRELLAGAEPEATISKLAEIWDPEIELDASDGPILDAAGVYRGANSVRQFWQEWFAAWETVQFEYEFVDAGDDVVMLLDLRMRGRSTGIEMPFGEIAWVSTFKDGLIVEAKLYMSQPEALKAAGLSEYAMSEKNLKDFIRSAYARFNEAQPDPSGEHKLASLDFYDRDAVYVNDARDPDAGIHQGIEAVRQQIGRWVEAYPDLRVEPLEIQTNDDQAFVWVRFSGHGAESAVSIDMELAHVVTVKGDKVLRVEEYSDRPDGLKAAGLSE